MHGIMLNAVAYFVHNLCVYTVSALFIFGIDICDQQRKGKVKEEQAGWETEER